MKLERKCNIEQRRFILRHVQYRKQKLKKESMHVRVRGHMLSTEKIARWLKEPALVKSFSNVRAPSRMFFLPPTFGGMRLISVALPSEISIRTALCPNSHRSHAGTPSCQHFLVETQASVALRILSIAQQRNQVLDAQQARSVFNDIQQLLETRNDPRGAWRGYSWHPSLEQHLVNIRNTMNLSSQLLVDDDLNCKSCL